MTRHQGLQMKGGVQLPMFALDAKPEPAAAAGPAAAAATEQTDPHRSALLSPYEPLSPIGDCSAELEVDQ